MSNTSIVVCGQKFDIGVPVILWDEPNGFNAYDTTAKTFYSEDRKTGKKIKTTISGKRYSSRNILSPNPTLEQLKSKVSQFFLHHTGVYTAKSTFEVLQNERGLSVHFILNDNGTLFQTLDVKEKAWHGGNNNPISIGIEICSRAAAGQYPDAYDEYHRKKYGLLPRNKRIDFVQKAWMEGYEYNDVQYRALIALGKALIKVFPQMKSNSKYSVDFPRDTKNRVIKSLLTQPLGWSGFICHYNTSSNKIDPISFDHERFLIGVHENNINQGSTFKDFTLTENRQKALTQLGFNPGPIDGDWGPKSAAALKSFQTSCGLTPDGNWGPRVSYTVDVELKVKGL